MSKSKVDSTARYLKTHEWARVENGEIVTGISDHAQEAMGDLVYVEVPKVGDVIAAGDRFGVVESVKAASDVYMPISGTITAVNGALEASMPMRLAQAGLSNSPRPIWRISKICSMQTPIRRCSMPRKSKPWAHQR
jgi:glycine cleavage system H lipoate-binding protein